MSRLIIHAPYGRKYDIWDTYTWTQLILPFGEEQAVYNGYWTLPLTGFQADDARPQRPDRRRRSTPDRSSCCDRVLQLSERRDADGNELNTGAYGFMRGNYRGCAGSGDMYGDSVDKTPGPWGIGIFGVKRDQSVDPGAKVATQGTRVGQVTDACRRLC